jgi:histidinol-phosphate aminotransferase
MKSREALFERLTEMGFDVLPSASNFLFARPPKRDARALLLALRERGIIVRHFGAQRIEEYLRITVGTDAECAALVRGLSQIFSASK